MSDAFARLPRIDRIARLGLWALAAAFVGLTFWLPSGYGEASDYGRNQPSFTMPGLVILGLLGVLLTAFPRWKRLQGPDHVRWAPTRNSELGGLTFACFWPLMMLAGVNLPRLWWQAHDYPRLVVGALVALVLAYSIGHSLYRFIAGSVSVEVSDRGLLLNARSARPIPWSDIEAVKLGYAGLESGVAIILRPGVDGRRLKAETVDGRGLIRLTPEGFGPTGRALVAAIQRFSPAAEIRLPSFQASFAAERACA